MNRDNVGSPFDLFSPGFFGPCYEVVLLNSPSPPTFLRRRRKSRAPVLFRTDAPFSSGSSPPVSGVFVPGPSTLAEYFPWDSPSFFLIDSGLGAVLLIGGRPLLLYIFPLPSCLFVFSHHPRGIRPAAPLAFLYLPSDPSGQSNSWLGSF